MGTHGVGASGLPCSRCCSPRGDPAPRGGCPSGKASCKSKPAICGGEFQRRTGGTAATLFLGLLGLWQPVHPDCARLSQPEEHGGCECPTLSKTDQGLQAAECPSGGRCPGLVDVRIQGGLAKAALVQQGVTLDTPLEKRAIPVPREAPALSSSQSSLHPSLDSCCCAGRTTAAPSCTWIISSLLHPVTQPC